MREKYLKTTISACMQCVYCCENIPRDWGTHDNNPNGEDSKEIENKFVIPSLCPLEDAE